jgi:prepilin signal peptidase PulO-like enzyme (type II secretory pathway)
MFMQTPLLVVLYVAYTGVLLYVSWTDIRTRLIPNKVIVPAIGVALVAMSWTLGVRSALLGAVLCPLPLIIGRMFSGANQVGMGDIKLAVFIGLILGYPLALWSVLIGLVLSLVVGLSGVVRGRYTLRSKLPFGPFLAAGALPLLMLLSLTTVG